MAEERVVVSKSIALVNAISSVITKVVNVTVLVWMFQYLLENIPTEEFAVYPVISALMVISPLFFSFFTGGISRNIVDAYERGEPDAVARVVSSIFPLLAGMSVIFIIVGVAAAQYIDRFLNIPATMYEEARLMMVLWVVSFAYQMLALPFAAGFHVRQKFTELNAILVAKELVRMAILLTLLLGVSTNIVWIVVATVIADALAQTVMILRSRRLLPDIRFRAALFNWTQAKELMNFGLWTTVGRLGGMLYTHAATIILNLYGTPTDVTNFYIGSTFYNQINSLIQTATAPLQPALTALNARQDQGRLGAIFLRSGRFGLWVAMLAAAPLIILGDVFVGLYLDAEFSDTAVVLTIFMLIFPFNQPTTLLSLVAMAVGKVRAFFLPAFLFQLLGAGLMLIFAAKFELGAVGAAIALFAITVGSQIAYYWSFALRLSDRTFGDFMRLTLIPGLIPAIGCVAALLAVRATATLDSYFDLLAAAAFGGLVYVATLLAFCMSSEDRSDLGAVIRKVREAARR